MMFQKLYKIVFFLFISAYLLTGGLLPANTVHAYNCGTGDMDCIVIGGSPEVISQVISLTSAPFEPIATTDPFHLLPGGVNESKTDLLNNQTDIAISSSACQSGVDDAGSTLLKCNQIVDTVFAKKSGQQWHLLTEPSSMKPLVGVYTTWLMSPAGQMIVKNAGYENVMPTVSNAGVSTTPGKLSAWGNNDKGQGVVPAEVANEKSFIAVASGYSHNLALTQTGDIYTWGDNSMGQLGLGNGSNQGWISTDAGGGQFGNITAIASGTNHSLAIMSISSGNTALYAWGDNRYGQLGDGTMTNRAQPVLVTVPELLNMDVKAIAAGDTFSLALTNDGKLISWGRDNPVPSELKDETFTAISASGMVGAALRVNGTVAAWGDQGDAPAEVNTGAKVIAIATGRTHFVALKEDGSLYVWGEDLAPAPTGLSGVAAIATGEVNAVALKSNGTVTQWDPYGGSLDPGLKGVTAITMGGYHNVAIVSPLQGPSSVPAWDLNGDRVTDIGDVAQVGMHWQETGAPGWIPEDVNRDGVVDIGDVAAVGLHWLETW